MTIPAASPTSAAYRDALLALQKQQRAQLTTLIQQTEAALHEDWTRGPGIVAQYYAPLIDQYARALNDLRALHGDPAARLSLDWLTSQNQSLRQIEANVKYSLDKFGIQSDETISAAQRAAALTGLEDASALTQEALSPAWEKGVNPAMLFSRPNPDAIAAWVGRAGNGHPLGDLFANFSSEATSAARQAMLLGLATGANPLQMVSGIQRAMGISRSRAITIARTEVLGSYRAAAHETYRQNSDVLGYWLWSAGGNNPCFPAGTMIRLADGSETAIEHVQLGDWVWTHRGRVRRVTGVMSRGYTGELITFDWPGMYRVTATAEHPFLVWYGGEARWLWACRVKPGLHQHFMMDFDDNGEPSMRLCYCNLQSEEVTQTPVYNLEVADDESYVANGFVVHNCAMCMGMDGTLHGLDESLDDHPCGKCAPLPVTKPWSDILGPLGIDASDLEETSIGAPGAYETGEEKFARMSPEKQREIIGTQTGYEAYQRGEVSLKDFIGVRPPSDGFPSSYYQKSLKELQIPTRQGQVGERVADLERATWATHSTESFLSEQLLRNGIPENIGVWTERNVRALERALVHTLAQTDLPADVRAGLERRLEELRAPRSPRPPPLAASRAPSQTAAAAARDMAEREMRAFGRAYEAALDDMFRASDEELQARLALRAAQSPEEVARAERALARARANLAAAEARFRALPQPDASMPTWARESAASRNVYQILRNGLPYHLDRSKRDLLIDNLGQVLKGDIPVNVRAAVERQLQALGQSVERQTVGAAARETTQAASREVVYGSDAMRERLMRPFGRPLTDDEVANLAGAPPGARVEIGRGGQITVTAPDGRYTSTSFILPDGDHLTLLNWVFKDASGTNQIAVDPEMLATQVRQAHQLGIDLIHMKSRSESRDFAELPLLGYNAPIGQALVESSSKVLPPGLKDAQSLLDLLATPEGTAWWLEHGLNPGLDFDPRPNSRSWRMLDAYLREHDMRGLDQ